MPRAPVALPRATINADWHAPTGRFLIHPAGLIEGLRPEWDAVRARRATLAARREPLVQAQPGRLVRILRRIGRLLKAVL